MVRHKGALDEWNGSEERLVTSPETHSIPAHPVAHSVTISPTKGWRFPDLQELWRYRDLLNVLVWRDLKVRYRQTILGAVWVMGQPLLTVVIFTLLFNRLARIQTGTSTPYSVYVLSGLLPWTYFSSAVQGSANSLLGSSHLISKVYFPRLLIPTSFVVTALVDFGVSCVLLGGLMAYHGIIPGMSILLLPIAVALALTFALGCGLWLAALNVEYRDIRVIIPFILQLWMYATPIVYPLHMLPGKWQAIAYLNPMTGIVGLFRYAVLKTQPSAFGVTVSAVAATVVLSSGTFFFSRMERRFADVI